MTLTIILNAILAVGAIVMVVTPLVWAILTQHRDLPPAAAAGDVRAKATAASRRRNPRPQHKPISWPV